MWSNFLLSAGYSLYITCYLLFVVNLLGSLCKVPWSLATCCKFNRYSSQKLLVANIACSSLQNLLVFLNKDRSLLIEETTCCKNWGLLIVKLLVANSLITPTYKLQFYWSFLWGRFGTFEMKDKLKVFLFLQKYAVLA